MKKLHIIKIFVVLALIFAVPQMTPAQNETTKNKPKTPQTVTDFYLLLPAKYFPFFDRAENRRDLIESEQIENGYLNFVGNRVGMPLDNEMLLLKTSNGTPMLVIAYTDCEAVLQFVEYKAGRWMEINAAPLFDLTEMREIYRRQTGREAAEKPRVYYSLSPIDKSLTVNFSGDPDVEIYKLNWNGSSYEFTAPKK